MSENKYEKGIKKIQEFTRFHSAEKPTGEMEIGEAYADMAPDLPRHVVEFAFGEIYAREGIDNKQKVLVTISSLVSQGMPQIAIHINSGLNIGLTPEEITSAIIHLLPYTGFPKVLNALKVAKEIFQERGSLA